LRQPLFNPTIAILLATTREELQDILSIRDLLWDIKIILIVPDMNRGTVAKGHTLRPRFLCDCNSDFVDVAAVFSLMIRNLSYDNNVDVHA
jgi:tRNA splicing ligase